MKKIISIAITIIAIVSILLVNIANNLDKIKINSRIYLYSFNEKIEFNNAKIKYYNGKSSLNSKDKTLELTSEPIYYKKGKTLLLPKDMSIVNYETGQIKKINHFSKIVQKKGDIYLDYYGDERILNKSFLYDGEDTYVFLEKINIKVGNDEFTMEPNSYLKLINNNSEMIVYLRESNKFFNVNITDTNVKAVSDYGYEINLKLDSFKNRNGEQLLFKNITNLSKY